METSTTTPAPESGEESSNHKWGHILSTRTLESLCFLIHDWFSEDLCCAGISSLVQDSELNEEFHSHSSTKVRQRIFKNTNEDTFCQQEHWNLSATWSMTDSVKICAVLDQPSIWCKTHSKMETSTATPALKSGEESSKSQMRTHSVNKNIGITLFLDPGLIHWRFVLCWDQPGIWCKTQSQMKTSTTTPAPKSGKESLEDMNGGHIPSTRTLETLWLLDPWTDSVKNCAVLGPVRNLAQDSESNGDFQSHSSTKVGHRIFKGHDMRTHSINKKIGNTLVLDWWTDLVKICAVPGPARNLMHKTQSEMETTRVTPAPKLGMESWKIMWWRTHSINKNSWESLWFLIDELIQWTICTVLGPAKNLVQDSESNGDCHNHSSTKVRWRIFKNTNEDTFCQQEHWHLSGSWSGTVSVKISAVLGLARNLVQDSKSNEEFHSHSSSKVRQRIMKNTMRTHSINKKIGNTLVLDWWTDLVKICAVPGPARNWMHQTQSQMETTRATPAPESGEECSESHDGGHIPSTRTLETLWFLIDELIWWTFVLCWD